MDAASAREDWASAPSSPFSQKAAGMGDSSTPQAYADPYAASHGRVEIERSYSSEIPREMLSALPRPRSSDGRSNKVQNEGERFPAAGVADGSAQKGGWRLWRKISRKGKGRPVVAQRGSGSPSVQLAGGRSGSPGGYEDPQEGGRTRRQKGYSEGGVMNGLESAEDALEPGNNDEEFVDAREDNLDERSSKNDGHDNDMGMVPHGYAPRGAEDEDEEYFNHDEKEIMGIHCFSFKVVVYKDPPHRHGRHNTRALPAPSTKLQPSSGNASPAPAAAGSPAQGAKSKGAWQKLGGSASKKLRQMVSPKLKPVTAGTPAAPGAGPGAAPALPPPAAASALLPPAANGGTLAGGKGSSLGGTGVSKAGLAAGFKPGKLLVRGMGKSHLFGLKSERRTLREACSRTGGM